MRKAYLTAMVEREGPRRYAMVFGDTEAEARANLRKPGRVRFGMREAHVVFPQDALILVADEQYGSALEGWISCWTSSTIDSYGRVYEAGLQANQVVVSLQKKEKRRTCS